MTRATQFLERDNLPVVGTFQAAGTVGAHLFENFGGRVGRLAHQPADRLLGSADLVATIGYDPVEYPPSEWNRPSSRKLIHVDIVRADLDNCYHPYIERRTRSKSPRRSSWSMTRVSAPLS